MLKHPLVNLLKANAGRGRHFTVEKPKADGGEAVFWFYDAIGVNPWDGSGIDPLAVAKELADMGNAPVRFRIHSPGGDAFDGRAIATAIASYSGPTTSQVDGYAASAASYVALAADRVEMAPGSFMMIHEGWTFAMGNKGDMLQCATMLENFDNSIIADYVRQTGNTEEQVTAWLEAETWFEAADAVKNGFADAVLGEAGGQPSAFFDLSAYAKAPAALKALKPAPVVEEPAKPAEPVVDLAAARRRTVAALTRRI